MNAPVTAPVSRAASDHVSMIQALTTILGVAGLCLVVLMIGLVASDTTDELLMIALSMAMTVLFTIPILLDRARPPAERHILISLCALGHWAYFAVPVFTQYFFLSLDVEGNLKLKNIAPHDIVQGQLVVIVGVLSMFLGYFYPLTAAVGRNLPKPTYDWPQVTALQVAVVMVGMGWFVTLTSQLGLLPSSLGSGALGAVAMGSYFGVGLLAILHARDGTRSAALLIWLIIPPSMAIAFLTGSKRFVLAPVMLAALGYFVVNRRVQLRWVLAGLGLLLVIYPVAQFWRDVVLAGDRLRMSDVVANPMRALSLISSFMSTMDPGLYFQSGLNATTSRLDALGIVTVIVRDTPDRVPFQGGWTLMNVAISFIPRVIWPDKPLIGIGQWVTDNYGSGPLIQSNTGSSWIGEFYFSYGYPGVILGMATLGAYFRFMHEIFFTTLTVPALLSCLVILWGTCTTIEMNLIAPFNGVIFTLFFVLIGHLYARLLGGARPRRAEADALPPPAADRETSLVG